MAQSSLPPCGSGSPGDPSWTGRPRGPCDTCTAPRWAGNVTAENVRGDTAGRARATQTAARPRPSFVPVTAVTSRGRREARRRWLCCCVSRSPESWRAGRARGLHGALRCAEDAAFARGLGSARGSGIEGGRAGMFCPELLQAASQRPRARASPDGKQQPCGWLCKPRGPPGHGGGASARPTPSGRCVNWLAHFIRSRWRRNIRRQGPTLTRRRGAAPQAAFSSRAPSLLRSARKGKGPRTLTSAGGRPPAVAPRAVLLAHRCGLLSSLKLEALVALVCHFTVQRELGP